MAASIEAGEATYPVKLRNLSVKGALVEGDDLPKVGAVVKFRKKELKLAGRVAWVTGRRAGIAFVENLDPEALMRHVPPMKSPVKFDFRRPRIKGVTLSPGERKIAEDWIWGDPITNHDN